MIIGGNGNNGNIRLLLSMDPSIIVKGDINGTKAGQDSLVLAAVNLPGEAATPVISTGNIGLITPLANLQTIQGQQNTNITGGQSPLVADISIPSGQLNLNGSINTIGNQTYTASNISLAGTNTLTSQNGTIEMITAFNGSISGLANTTFALGSTANLGSNLGSLHPANLYRITDSDQINPVNYQYAVNIVQSQQTMQSMLSSANEISVNSGGVTVSMGDTVTKAAGTSLRDASEAICAPIEGATCEGK